MLKCGLVESIGATTTITTAATSNIAVATTNTEAAVGAADAVTTTTTNKNINKDEKNFPLTLSTYYSSFLLLKIFYLRPLLHQDIFYDFNLPTPVT
jgi:hypothetical protein